MVISNKLYSPQNYLEMVTGNCYLINNDNDIDGIEFILAYDGISGILNYPLDEIVHVIGDDIGVVLVDCMVWNEDRSEFDHEYRWFEVPSSIFEDYKNLIKG